METLVSRLGAAGVRLTAQRRVIAECLDGTNKHLTADELLAVSKRTLPEIGRATVYKSLTEFVAAGSVREVQMGDGPKRFDPNAHIAHHHLICTGCGGIWDVASKVCEVTPSQDSDFKLTHTEVSFFGLCAACSETVVT